MIPKECRIILADDHKIFRAGLKSLLDKESGFKIVGQAQDGEDLLSVVRTVKCDLIVLDLSMPKLDGIGALKILSKKYPHLKILILTMLKDNEHFKQAMSGGASGYMLKEDAFDQLVRALKTLMQNWQYVSPSMTVLDNDCLGGLRENPQTPSLEILTNREKEILKGIVSGMANKNIAASLNISVRTVEAHRGHLTSKLGIKTTANLVKYAMAKRMI